MPDAKAICDYEYSDDYYAEGHTCELPAGHSGPHRVVLEWDTRQWDICREQGHIWGAWKPFTPLLRTAPQLMQRECTRCRRTERVAPSEMNSYGTGSSS